MLVRPREGKYGLLDTIPIYKRAISATHIGFLFRAAQYGEKQNKKQKQNKTKQKQKQHKHIHIHTHKKTALTFGQLL